ncbi:MAG: Holliday junction branch migration DNA helicase RuvB [Patescibacteria group bacterium]|nr:Holliday junction branch migration DNA helicase RuvB [Patescibacteria group bacterium]
MPKKVKTSKNIIKDDQFIDSFLRPKTFNDYIGQGKIKKGLEIILKAAQKRRESIDHLLFYGQPGLGKTTLATLVAGETGANLRIVSAPSLNRTGDLAALLTNLEERDVLFIDEAHRLNPAVEEVFYSAMDSGRLNITIGKGPSSRIIPIDLPPFTLIAATTRINLISSPLRSRFGAIFRLDYYNNEEINTIIERSADILKIKIALDAVSTIAKASRFTPRLANRLLKRSRDIAEVNDIRVIKREIVLEAFDMLGIDEMGLEIHDRRLLEIMIEKFGNRPVGINSLAASLGEDKDTIEEIYEPYLLKIGFIQRTPSGRIATSEAKKWLGY